MFYPRSAQNIGNFNFAYFASIEDLQNYVRQMGTSSDKNWVTDLSTPFPKIKALNELVEATKNIVNSIDLGGSFTKAKLQITDKQTGIFDFGLASLGLQRLIEFYSDELALEFPQAFVSEGLAPGLVPNILVEKDEFLRFFIEYNGKKYILQRRQKGTTLAQIQYPNIKLIDQLGVTIPENATEPQIAELLGYTSVQKRSYVEMKKIGGTTPFLDLILPLNLLAQTTNTSMMLNSILPALCCASILERAGIQTRLLCGRVVFLPGQSKGRYQNKQLYDLDAIQDKTVTQFGNAFGDWYLPSYFDVNPPANVACLIAIKQRGEAPNYNLIAQLLSNIDTREPFANFAWNFFPNNCRDGRGPSTAWTTYTYPTGMDYVAKNYGAWQQYVATNNLEGDFRDSGSFTSNNTIYASEKTSKKLSPTPIDKVIGCFLQGTSYDAMADLQSGQLTKMSHPFGYAFYRTLDRAELALSENPSKVVARIWKRLIKEGYSKQEIKKYLELNVVSMAEKQGADGIGEYSALYPSYIPQGPPFVYPIKLDFRKKMLNKSKDLLKAYQNILSR